MKLLCTKVIYLSEHGGVLIKSLELHDHLQAIEVRGQETRKERVCHDFIPHSHSTTASVVVVVVLLLLLAVVSVVMMILMMMRTNVVVIAHLSRTRRNVVVVVVAQ